MTGPDRAEGTAVLSDEEREAACEVMHDAYEKAAAGHGWETQERSRVPWADVPEANKATMRAAVDALTNHLAARAALPGTADTGAREAVEALAAKWEVEASEPGGHDLLVQTYRNHARDLRAALAATRHQLLDRPEVIFPRCSCGWEPRLGESVRRAFDKHLLDVRAVDRAGD